MGESQKISTSVIICTLHNLQGLIKCIDSIMEQTRKPDEVIIVHGDIDEEMEESITKRMHLLLQSNRITLQYVKTIRSLVMQRNIGIDHARSDVIVFLDDDVVLERDYFHYLLEAYHSKWSKSLGGIQGTIIEGINEYKPWQLKEIVRKLFLLGGMTGGGSLLPSVNASYCGNPKEMRRVDIFNGCMMSFRREVLHVNRFDSNFRELWACDDVELSYRISKQYELYQTPLARLHHIQSSLTKEGHKNITRMFVFNRLYVFRLYFSNLKANWLLFLWSNIGELFYRIFLSVKLKSTGPISGFLEGWKLIFISKGHPYREIKKEEE
jgi:glycosyltransferase involved in cell wall biosynthesis